MKTLIILHGWQSSKERWQKVKDLLEENGELEVVIPDLPGFKQESELDRVWSLDDYVDWLASVTENRERFYLLGHSFGGRIGIKFAIKYSYKLYGLILVSAAGIKKEKTVFEDVLEKGAEFSRALRIGEIPIIKEIWGLLRKFVYSILLRKTDYLKVSGFLKGTIKKVLNEDLSPFLSEIKVPSFIVWGEKDKITPLGDAYLMNKEMKFSQLEILNGIGHRPHMENPELLVQTIEKFIG